MEYKPNLNPITILLCRRTCNAIGLIVALCAFGQPALAAQTRSDAECKPLSDLSHTVTANVAGGSGTVSPPRQNVQQCGNAVFSIMAAEGWEAEVVTGDSCAPANYGLGFWVADLIVTSCHVQVHFVPVGHEGARKAADKNS